MDGQGDAPAARTWVSEGLTLSYADWGNHGAPVLILLHGMADHARSWDATARAFRADWHVVAPDLRGHGDSAWSPDGAYQLPYHVLDLAALIETLGPAPVTLVAHSLGGSVASRHAAVHPASLDRLVLVEGLGPSPQSFAQWAETGAVRRMADWMAQRREVNAKAPRRLGSVADAAARMKARNTRLTITQALHLAEHGTRAHPDGLGWKFDPRVGMFTPDDFAIPPAAFWPAVTMPVLIVSGAESWTGDPVANGYDAVFPDARVVSIAEAGHWPHHDQLDIFTTALRDFLAPATDQDRP